MAPAVSIDPPGVDPLVDQFRQDAAVSHAADIRMARVALQIARSDRIAKAGCASFGEYGERHLNVSHARAYRLLDLGRSLERWPECAGDLEAGRTTVEAVSRLGALTRVSGAVRPGDDWPSTARSVPTRTLERMVVQRLEEVRVGERSVEKTFFVTEQGARDFERARVIASRKEGRALTQGETLVRVTDHYLDAFDLLRKEGRKRRMPDTALLPHRRDLPAAVRRHLFRRTGDVCAVPGCLNSLFLENSHRRAHAAGGDREARNLDRLCSAHHELYEAGLLGIEGTTEAPIFRTAAGKILAAGRTPPATAPEEIQGQGAHAELPAPTEDSDEPPALRTLGPDP
jgi:hypothetical protein